MDSGGFGGRGLRGCPVFVPPLPSDDTRDSLRQSSRLVSQFPNLLTHGWFRAGHETQTGLSRRLLGLV